MSVNSAFFWTLIAKIQTCICWLRLRAVRGPSASRKSVLMLWNSSRAASSRDNCDVCVGGGGGGGGGGGLPVRSKGQQADGSHNEKDAQQKRIPRVYTLLLNPSLGMNAYMLA